MGLCRQPWPVRARHIKRAQPGAPATGQPHMCPRIDDMNYGQLAGTFHPGCYGAPQVTGLVNGSAAEAVKRRDVRRCARPTAISSMIGRLVTVRWEAPRAEANVSNPCEIIPMGHFAAAYYSYACSVA